MNHARTFATRQAAESHKLFLAGGLVAVEHEPCSGWHLEAAERAPLPSQKPAPRQKPFPSAIASLIDARDVHPLTGERCCQRCMTTSGLHRHHRRLKQAGGSDRPCTQCACAGLVLCFRCHIPWAHEHRAESGDLGYIVPQFVEAPGDVSVARFALIPDVQSEWWPTCDGRWVA